MRDAKRLEMLKLVRSIATIDTREPHGSSASAVNYVNKLNRAVIECRVFMNKLNHEDHVRIAFQHWIDVFKPDAVAEGWDIRLTGHKFTEFQVVDIKSGFMTDTVMLNVLDGQGEHHIAAREFMFNYSQVLFEAMRERQREITLASVPKTVSDAMFDASTRVLPLTGQVGGDPWPASGM